MYKYCPINDEKGYENGYEDTLRDLMITNNLKRIISGDIDTRNKPNFLTQR
jgi:hypothetical protein